MRPVLREACDLTAADLRTLEPSLAAHILWSDSLVGRLMVVAQWWKAGGHNLARGDARVQRAARMLLRFRVREAFRAAAPVLFAEGTEAARGAALMWRTLREEILP